MRHATTKSQSPRRRHTTQRRLLYRCCTLSTMGFNAHHWWRSLFPMWNPDGTSTLGPYDSLGPFQNRAFAISGRTAPCCHKRDDSALTSSSTFNVDLPRTWITILSRGKKGIDRAHTTIFWQGLLSIYCPRYRYRYLSNSSKSTDDDSGSALSALVRAHHEVLPMAAAAAPPLRGEPSRRRARARAGTSVLRGRAVPLGLRGAELRSRQLRVPVLSGGTAATAHRS